MIVCVLPSIVATARNHTQWLAILMLNLFAGWTFIGWVAAMVWASATLKSRPQHPSQHPREWESNAR